MLQRRKKGTKDKFRTQLQSYIFSIHFGEGKKNSHLNKVVSPLLEVFSTYNFGEAVIETSKIQNLFI
jgi:hypothetical protein